MNREDTPRQENTAAAVMGRVKANAARVLAVVVGGTAGYLAGEAVTSTGAGPLAGVVAGTATAIGVEIAIEIGMEWLGEQTERESTTPPV